MFCRYPLSSIPYLASTLPVFVVASLFWTAWDPTYMTIQGGAAQGREVRVHGKQNYIVGTSLINQPPYTYATQALQMSAWLSRLLISLVLAFGHRSAFLTRYVAAHPRIYLSLSFLIELAVSPHPSQGFSRGSTPCPRPSLHTTPASKSSIPRPSGS